MAVSRSMILAAASIRIRHILDDASDIPANARYEEDGAGAATDVRYEEDGVTIRLTEE